MIKFLRLTFILAAFTGVLGLAACGGGDGDDGGGSDGPTATSEATDEGDATQPDGASGNANDELDALAEEFGGREMNVTYELSSSDGTAGSYTIYWKPPDWRVDYESDGSVANIIQSGGLVYICSGDGAGGGQCIESPGGAASAIPVPFFGSLTAENGLSGLVASAFGGADVDRSEETIAGRDATCFKVSGAIEGDAGFAEICSADGILLRWEGGSGLGGVKIEATAVQDTVADADFDLPYEILQVPGT